jgi:hypothetical protein
MDPAERWLSFLIGYLASIAVETPVLLIGLSPRHPLSRRLFCGVWLTACTYPVVALVLPEMFDPDRQRWLYLLVAETFAPATECALFWAAFGQRSERWRLSMWRDLGVVVLANLASFGVGEAYYAWEENHRQPVAPAAESVTIVGDAGRARGGARPERPTEVLPCDSGSCPPRRWCCWAPLRPSAPTCALPPSRRRTPSRSGRARSNSSSRSMTGRPTPA